MNPPHRNNRPQNSDSGAEAVVWSGSTEFNCGEVKLWVGRSHIHTAGEEGRKKVTCFIHEHFYNQQAARGLYWHCLLVLFIHPAGRERWPQRPDPSDWRRLHQRRLHQRRTSSFSSSSCGSLCRHSTLKELVQLVIEASKEDWEAGAGEAFAYGCAHHCLSCGRRVVSLREESGSVFVRPSV